MKILRQTACMIICIFVFLAAGASNLSAQFTQEQNNSQLVISEPGEQNQKTADELRNVMLIILIVWLGVGAYLFLIDRKISKLEKELSEYEK